MFKNTCFYLKMNPIYKESHQFISVFMQPSLSDFKLIYLNTFCYTFASTVLFSISITQAHCIRFVKKETPE